MTIYFYMFDIYIYIDMLCHIQAYWKINRYLYTFLMDVCLWQLNTSTPERSPDTCMAESRRLEIHWCFPQHHNLIYHETWKTRSVSSILFGYFWVVYDLESIHKRWDCRIVGSNTWSFRASTKRCFYKRYPRFLRPWMFKETLIFSKEHK